MFCQILHCFISHYQGEELEAPSSEQVEEASSSSVRDDESVVPVDSAAMLAPEPDAASVSSTLFMITLP